MYPNGKSSIPDPTKQPAFPDPGNEKGHPPSYTPAVGSSSTAFQTNFASLSLHMQDRLRFLHFPNEVVDLCRRAILTVWPRGIQQEREYGGSKEIKLYGTPWSAINSGDEAMNARRLVCSLLGTLHGLGWVLTLSTDISRKNLDKDTLIFRHQVPAPTECEWFCIGFSMTDRLRFIDAPLEIATTLISRLGRVVQRHGPYLKGVYELKLFGSPWRADGTETMRVRELLLIMLEVLESEGWTVYASVDQKNGSKERSETDTWHCCRPKGWERGAPVYHH